MLYLGCKWAMLDHVKHGLVERAEEDVASRHKTHILKRDKEHTDPSADMFCLDLESMPTANTEGLSQSSPIPDNISRP